MARLVGEMLRQEQRAACDDGDGDRSAGSGEQKRRWRLAMARCLRRLRAACGDGDGTEVLGRWRVRVLFGELGPWLTAAGWRRSPSVVCSTSRSKMKS
ncbi:unnamed protein product [Linum trigynum]|uniref:Uncharacterized protein n=1 Tax=Linum trigynum TaxID=586398 RepID=A0AAV2EI03_9ROSI